MENQEEALYRYGKALEIYKAEDGTSTDQKDVAEVHNAISVVKESMEEYDDALEQYKEALAIQLALDAEGDASTATSYCNIAGVLLKNNNTDGKHLQTTNKQ